MTDAVADNEEEERTFESRRDGRIAALPAVYKRHDERMALELVLLPPDADPWQVISSYGYTPEQARAVLASPAFIALIVAARRDVDENGVGFVAKARLQSEALLQDAFDMATDPLVSAAVRMDSIKWQAAVAGYGPKKDENKGGGTGGGFNISITFAAPRAQPELVQGITIEADE